MRGGLFGRRLPGHQTIIMAGKPSTGFCDSVFVSFRMQVWSLIWRLVGALEKFLWFGFLTEELQRLSGLLRNTFAEVVLVP